MKQWVKKVAFLKVCTVLAFASGTVFAAEENKPAGAGTAQDLAIAQAHPYEGLDNFIDGMVNSHLQTLEVSAVSVSVVKDGHVIFAKGYGMQNREKDIPANAETSLFRIGSTSKLFTWTAVMQQVEQGRIDLDEDVNQYLKDFQIPDTYPEPITMRHILTHTAGFEDGALGYLIKYDPAQSLSLREAMKIYVPARINPPGKYASYSNYATALAGLIVENVSGVPFDDYIEQHIYAPLGMENSTFREPLPDSLKAGQTVGYLREAGAQVPQPYELIGSFGPAGSMASSARDMARFMTAHLQDGSYNGQQILKPETARQMHSVIRKLDPRLGGMAHGFYEVFVNGHRLVGHGGDTFQFHTEMLIDKAEQLGIFVSYATADDRAGRDTFVETFYDHYYPQDVAPVTPPADFDSYADKYAGTYGFWRHNESTIEKAFAIMSSGIQISPSGKGTLVMAGFGEPRQFVEIGENLFRQVDGPQRIAFRADETGKIEDLLIDGLPFMDASRVPAFETGFFTMFLPIVILISFLIIFVDWLYRRKAYKQMKKEERTAIRLSMAVAGLNLLFLIFLGVIAASYGMDLFVAIPAVFDVNLVLPIIAAVMTVGFVYFAVEAWRKGYWALERRIWFSLTALGAFYMVIYYYHWNVLGFQHF